MTRRIKKPTLNFIYYAINTKSKENCNFILPGNMGSANDELWKLDGLCGIQK